MRRYAKLVSAPPWVHVAAPRPTSEAQHLVIVMQYISIEATSSIHYTIKYTLLYWSTRRPEDSEALETGLQRLDSLDPETLSQLTEIVTTALLLLPFFWKPAVSVLCCACEVYKPSLVSPEDA